MSSVFHDCKCLHTQLCPYPTDHYDIEWTAWCKWICKCLECWALLNQYHKSCRDQGTVNPGIIYFKCMKIPREYKSLRSCRTIGRGECHTKRRGEGGREESNNRKSITVQNKREGSTKCDIKWGKLQTQNAPASPARCSAQRQRQQPEPCGREWKDAGGASDLLRSVAQRRADEQC